MRLSSDACPQLNAPDLTVVPPPGAESYEAVKPEGARKIEQSIAYMMQHLNQPLQVAKLAQTAHTSPSHFFVLFKRWVGSSPIDYFIRLRMQQACRLLTATNLSVKEIAADLGYDDPFYFSRVFKSVHGVAPSDFRVMTGNLETADSGVEKNGVLPPLPISELLENNGGNDRVPAEKHELSDAAPGIYLLQRG